MHIEEASHSWELVETAVYLLVQCSTCILACAEGRRQTANLFSLLTVPRRTYSTHLIHFCQGSPIPTIRITTCTLYIPIPDLPNSWGGTRSRCWDVDGKSTEGGQWWPRVQSRSLRKLQITWRHSQEVPRESKYIHSLSFRWFSN